MFAQKENGQDHMVEIPFYNAHRLHGIKGTSDQKLQISNSKEICL